MDKQKATELYQQWVDAWNGDLAVINATVSGDFIFHRENGQADVHGPQELSTLIEGSRAAFSELVFKTQLGPLFDNGWIAARNRAEGTYSGGVPGATAEAGAKISLVGIDMLRVEDGKIVECWHNGNDLAFMLQLGVVKTS